MIKWKELVHTFSKFTVVGGFMAVLSMSANYLFLEVLHTPLLITYAVNYLVTIFISYHLNRTYTFKSGYSFKSMAQYYLVYASGLLLGMLLLWVFRMILPFGNWILTLCVLPFTTMSNFLLSRLVFSNNKSKEQYDLQ